VQIGVDAENLTRRVRFLGWKKERAINGYQTFMNRINNHNWDKERAAAEPLQDRKAAASKATEAVRIISRKYIEMAEKNGIHTMRARIKKGWEPELAATQPVMTNKKAGQMGAERVRELYGDWNRFSFKQA
jgi:hypothetical protein